MISYFIQSFLRILNVIELVSNALKSSINPKSRRIVTKIGCNASAFSHWNNSGLPLLLVLLFISGVTKPALAGTFVKYGGVFQSNASDVADGERIILQVLNNNEVAALNQNRSITLLRTEKTAPGEVTYFYESNIFGFYYPNATGINCLAAPPNDNFDSLLSDVKARSASNFSANPGFCSVVCILDLASISSVPTLGHIDFIYLVNGQRSTNTAGACPAAGFTEQVTAKKVFAEIVTTEDPKNLSCEDGDLMRGNPVNVGTGNKYQIETDYMGVGTFPLTLQRHYNSRSISRTTQFGASWTASYASKLAISTGGGGLTNVSIFRDNGKILFFTQNGSVFVSDGDVNDKLSRQTDANGVTTGWTYKLGSSETVESYDAVGKLLSITDRMGNYHVMTYSDGATLPSIASVPGLLIRVTETFGRQLNFTYGIDRNVSSMTDPEGRVYRYTYDLVGNLASVTYPDNTPTVTADNPQRIYLYNEPAYTSNTNFPHALTGITDENTTRYAAWSYDAFARVSASEHAGGAGKITVSYPGSSTSYVTDYKDSVNTGNVQNTYTTQTVQGSVKTSSVSQPCASCGGGTSTAKSYDANGNPTSSTDFNGNKTTFAYDLTRNLETQRIEALTSAGATTPQSRTISTEWHANWRLPKRMAEPKRITSYVYNGDSGNYCAPTTALVNGIPIGVLCSKTITETTDANGSLAFGAAATVPANVRTSTYTYNNLGQMLSSNAPRTDVTDVTTYAYFASNDALGNYRIGDLNTVTNALGHVTTISAYDAHGRPKTITDANGLVTQLTYTPRGWLNSRNVGGLLTQFTYDNVGQLTKVTLPDASFIGYAYDAAHRLTQITNAAGDKLVYTLDLMGNRTKEEVFTSANVVVQRKHRVFDNLSRLATELNAANAVIAAYTYDNNGNVKTQTQKYDAVTTNDAITGFDYDPLNRLTKITNALAGITQYAYNGVDQLVSVTDPKSLITSYTVDGLDNQKQQISPDTGTTNSTYDAAGNLKTSTDARSKVSSYSYDALNRVTGVTFSDTTPTLGYLYDDITLGNFGKGRLTKITDATGNTTYKYDIQGRLIQKTQTTGTVVKTIGYGYDTVGRMSSMTYPSGKVLSYGFDVQGRIASMAVNAVNLVSNITYQPFGPAKSWTWSGGPVQTRAFDLDGRQTSYPYSATGTVNLTYDLGNRIKNLTGTVAKTYGYDKLDRLTSYSNEIYAYDADGNRSSHTVSATSYPYTYPSSSNRLTSFTGPAARSYSYDASGNTLTTSSGYAFTYDARGRMTNITTGSVNQYGINALGQRLTKAGTGYIGTQRYVYSEEGKLLGEYDNTGATITEHVYLQDMPIAAMKAAGAYLVQTDQLNTPRAILGAANALVWKWDSDAFGVTAANENPSALGVFNYNLRFPGQYYDKESAFHYNYFRDYNPKTGRYIESDPIGLLGGVNTYSYGGKSGYVFGSFGPLHFCRSLWSKCCSTYWRCCCRGGSGVGDQPASQNA